MRHIQVEDGLRLRFPDRPNAFDDGVEIGIVAGLMAVGNAFTRPVSAHMIAEVRSLADKLGYRVAVGPGGDELIETTFNLGRVRPALRLVHSRVDDADAKKPIPGSDQRPALGRLAVGAP